MYGFILKRYIFFFKFDIFQTQQKYIPNRYYLDKKISNWYLQDCICIKIDAILWEKICVFNYSNLIFDFHCNKKYVRVTLLVQVFELILYNNKY